MQILLQSIAIIFTVALLGCNQEPVVEDGNVSVEHGNVSIDWSPDGTTVVFSSADGDLYLFNIESEAVTRLTSTDAIESVPSYSPDGKSIVYAVAPRKGAARRIHVLNLSNRVSTPLTEEDKTSDFLPRFSVDGKTIVFGRAYRNRLYSMGGTVWDNWDVCEMDVNGKNLKRLTNENYYQLFRMVPKTDGSIVYSAGTDAELYTLAKDGDPKRTLPETENQTKKVHAWASDVMISPDETNIVFTSDRTRPFWYDVCLCSDGKKTTGLVGSKSRYNRYPDFSPDGKRILFMAGTKFGNGNRPIFSLWEVSVNGKSREIASDELFTDPLNYRRKNEE